MHKAHNDMIVLIDAGNTLIKLGWLNTSTGQREAAPLALPHAQISQLSSWLQQLPYKPTAALGVNVAGAAIATALEALFKAAMLSPPRWVTSQALELGVRNAYQSPTQLGPDRWVAMLGLAKRSNPLLNNKPNARRAHTSTPQSQSQSQPQPQPPPIILATFGTATTIDTLCTDEQGFSFCGGIILPGPALMHSSLVKGTANLPHANGNTAAYPTNTQQAIVTGIAAAQAGALIRQWLAGLERYGRPARIYVAGGGWPLVQAETERLLAAAQTHTDLPIMPVVWLAAPVLDGLACLAIE